MMAERSELPLEVAAALNQLDDLVRRFEQHPEPAVQDRAVELLRSVDIIHRSGLRRLAELLKVAGLERRALDDPEVRLLYDLYELGEGGECDRAAAVLEMVRPYIEAGGATVDLVDAAPGSVRVRARMLSAGDSCQTPAAVLREAIEQVLRQELPDVAQFAVDVQEPEPAPPSNGSFIPLANVKVVRRPSMAWRAVFSVEGLPEGEVRGLELDGKSVLVAQVGGEHFAYRNVCPGSPLPLHGGVVEDGVLVCPWHRCRFDLRGGRRVDSAGVGLGVLPIRVEAGEVRIGIQEQPRDAAA